MERSATVLCALAGVVKKMNAYFNQQKSERFREEIDRRHGTGTVRVPCELSSKTVKRTQDWYTPEKRTRYLWTVTSLCVVVRAVITVCSTRN